MYAAPGKEDSFYILQRPQRPACMDYQAISETHSDDSLVNIIIVINEYVDGAEVFPDVSQWGGMLRADRRSGRAAKLARSSSALKGKKVRRPHFLRS